MECDSHDDEPDPKMMKDLFGFSSKHDYQIRKPDEVSRCHQFYPS